MARLSSGKKAKREANKLRRRSERKANKANAHYLRFGPKGSSESPAQQRFRKGPEWGKKKTNHMRGFALAAHEARRTQAEERKTMRNELSAEEQLAALDTRLGVGVGAEKERKKLISKTISKPTPTKEPIEVKEPKTKLKAKERNISGVSGGRMVNGGRV